MSRTANDVIDLIQKHQSTGQGLLYRFGGAADIEYSAEGNWVIGAEGTRFLDFGSYGVFLIGHQHPHVVKAVTAQLSRLACSSRSLPNAVNADAGAALAAVAPPGLTKVMFLNGGTEAVEAAVKICRAGTKRAAICHAEGSYHGKTFGSLSLTDNPIFKEKVAPLLSDVHRLPKNDAAAASDMVRSIKPAAVFVEPVQGEGGIFEFSSDWLQQVRRACTEAGAMFVCDEIQCGLGRTGSMWACEEAGVVPDMLIAGKSLGGGVMPVSAVIATPNAFMPLDRDPLLHSSTFGGNPLACAAVISTLEVIREEKIPVKAKEQGAAVRQILEELLKSYSDLFSGLSGRGLMLGLHCARPDIAGTLIRQASAVRLLVTPCISKPSVVRVSPTAQLGAPELDFARKAFEEAAIATRRELAST